MAEKSDKKSDKKSSKSNKTDNENSSFPVDSKKPSMKTASDVISRLLWDDSLPQSKFVVGYLDRFDGIVEKKFDSLDWRDPSVVDNYTLALPKHRIQYFKYKNRKVWDKRTRKDIIFGSTGYPLSIYDFMSSVDQELSDFHEEGLNSTNKEAQGESSDTEGSEEEYDNSERANFFIAARITNEDTIKNLKEVSDYIKARDEHLGSCCIPPEMYHLTLSILKLGSPSEICEAISALQCLASKHLPLAVINLDGLDNFRHRVLYSCVEANEELINLRTALVDELVSRKLNITDKFSFVPHVTIAKLNRPATRLRHNKYIDQYFYLKFEDNEFGIAEINTLYLCEMGEARRDDGFYRCAAEVALN
ncbi:uncharacterized protein LOC118191810 isoform X2 [Stegodyphus dumicola]|nr:uncharacterized protein LOC118191810 isoform X2 [Stegodyphus dumicola]